MKIEKLVALDTQTTRFTLDVSNAEIAMMQNEILPEAIKLVAKAIADDILEKHRDSMMQMVNPKLILNQAIALVVNRLGGR